MKFYGCSSCIFARTNASDRDIESQNYCSGLFAYDTDGYRAYPGPVRENLKQFFVQARPKGIPVEKTFWKPKILANGKPDCPGFKLATYKLVVEAELADVNGIFVRGPFASVEDAIFFEQEEFAPKYINFHGASVRVVETKQNVAVSNGSWKQSDADTHYWHCSPFSI